MCFTARQSAQGLHVLCLISDPLFPTTYLYESAPFERFNRSFHLYQVTCHKLVHLITLARHDMSGLRGRACLFAHCCIFSAWLSEQIRCMAVPSA